MFNFKFLKTYIPLGSRNTWKNLKYFKNFQKNPLKKLVKKIRQKNPSKKSYKKIRQKEFVKNILKKKSSWNLQEPIQSNTKVTKENAFHQANLGS